MIVISGSVALPHPFWGSERAADIKRVKILKARVPYHSDWSSLRVSPPCPLTRIPGDNTIPQSSQSEHQMNRIAADRWLLDAAREILRGILVISWLRSYRWEYEVGPQGQPKTCIWECLKTLSVRLLGDFKLLLACFFLGAILFREALREKVGCVVKHGRLSTRYMDLMPSRQGKGKVLPWTEDFGGMCRRAFPCLRTYENVSFLRHFLQQLSFACAHARALKTEISFIVLEVEIKASL